MWQAVGQRVKAIFVPSEDHSAPRPLFVRLVAPVPLALIVSIPGENELTAIFPFAPGKAA